MSVIFAIELIAPKKCAAGLEVTDRYFIYMYSTKASFIALLLTHDIAEVVTGSMHRTRNSHPVSLLSDRL